MFTKETADWPRYYINKNFDNYRVKKRLFIAVAFFLVLVFDKLFCGAEIVSV